MYIWDVLEIKPTKDKGKIQEAYAKLTKRYHPEEYPEEFKKIQKAYKQAIKYTKDTVRYNSLLDNEIEIIKKVYNSKKTISKEVENIDLLEDFQEKSEFDYSKVEAKRNQQEESYYEDDQLAFYRVKKPKSPYDIEERVAYIEEFMAMFKVLGHHFYTRNNVDCWRFIFEDSRYTKLYNQEWFITAIISGIDKMNYLNRAVLEYLDYTIGRNSPTGKEMTITVVLENKIRSQRVKNFNNIPKDQEEQLEYEFIKKQVDECEDDDKNWNKDTLYAKLYIESIDQREYLRYEYRYNKEKKRKKQKIIVSILLLIYFIVMAIVLILICQWLTDLAKY